MVIDYLKSVQKSRAAARNFCILSSLEDEVLRDIGLERDMLRAFCDAGCRHTAASPVSEPVTPLSILLAQAMRPALR